MTLQRSAFETQRREKEPPGRAAGGVCYLVCCDFAPHVMGRGRGQFQPLPRYQR